MKFANKKRAASTVLAGAMALSMATPAFAAAEKTTTINGTYSEIALAVTVPTTGKAIINPYGLPIALDEDTSISGQQITTGAPLVISNQSKVALAVKAKVSGKATGETVLKASADDVKADNKKNVYVNFEAFKAPGVLDDTDAADLNDQFAKLDSKDAVLTANVSETATDAAPAVTGKDLILRAGDEEGATQDGGAAFFRLSGSVNRDVGTDWAKTDGFTTTIAFTFEPSEYVGTVELKADGGATSVTEGGTLKVSVALPAGVKVQKGSEKWTTSKETNIKVATDSSNTATNTLVGTVTGVAEITSKVKISVEFTGSDGVTYKSNDLSLTCEAAPTTP